MDAAYIKKTLKIAWFGAKNNKVCIGLLLLGFCAIIPVFLLATASEDLREKDYISLSWGLFAFLAAVSGTTLPTAMLSFVQKRRNNDFYNSMPVKRSQYFTGYFISFLGIFLACFIIMSLELFALSFGLVPDGAMVPFLYYFKAVGVFFIIYSVTALSVMFSGSLLSTAVTFCLLNCLPLCVFSIFLLLSSDLNFGSYFTLLQPLICLLTPLASVLTEIDGWTFAGQLIIALAELVTAFFLHKLRRGETTMALAFPKTRYPYQYTVMFLACLCGALLGSNRIVYMSNGTFFQAILMAVAVLAAFILLNMILEKDPKAAFRKLRHFFIAFAGSLCVILAVVTALSSLPSFIIPINPNAAVIKIYGAQDITELVGGEYYETEDGYYYEYDYDYDLLYDENGTKKYYRYYIKEIIAVTDPESIQTLKSEMQDMYNGLCNELSERYYWYSESERNEFLSEGSFFRYVITFIDTNTEICDNMPIDDVLLSSDKQWGLNGYVGSLEALTQYKNYTLTMTN